VLARRSREIYSAEIFAKDHIGRQTPRAPPAPRAGAAPTESHARIVVVYPIECDNIYINRFISHDVIVSVFITLQKLHRRFRPGTPCFGLILKTYSRQKPRNSCTSKIKGSIYIWNAGLSYLQT